MFEKIKILFSLIITLLVIPFSYGIGVGLYTTEIDFNPNLNENFMGVVSNNVEEDIRVELRSKGELAKYVTFGQDFIDIPKWQTASFSFNIKLPEYCEEIKPGLNEIYIGAEDITYPVVGGISTKTAAFWPFRIRVPYPGKYIEGGFTAQDIELDGTVMFNVNVISRGKEVINKIDGIIEVFNQDNKIATLTLDPIMGIKPEESKTIQAKWDSKGHEIGEYKAKATINYDEQQLALDTKFRIGTLLVKIINYTKEFYKDEINKFDIEIESFWNMEVSKVYGEIEVEKQKIKTLETNLAPWSKTKITAYLDTTNLELGEHTANIKVYYADKVAEELGKIIVLPKREKIVELPSKTPPTTILLIAIIILLVIGNIVLILHFLKHGKNSKKPEKNRKTSFPYPNQSLREVKKK